MSQSSTPHPFSGMRYINHIRVSSKSQERSAQAQLEVNNEFGKRTGMTHVKDIILEGVSGSKTFNRRDIEAIIDEKMANDSFDIVLYRDLSRLTRGGIGHGHAVKQRLKTAGITIIPVLDTIPEGPMGELYETLLFFQNQEYSRKLSQHITPSLIDSIKAHRRPPNNRPLYGFDRLYFGPDGTPTRIVRCTSTQREIIDPRTKEVLQRIPNDLPFTKARYEGCRLILGTPERVEIVRWVFEQIHKLDRSPVNVAGDLNDRGIRSPSGGDWNPTTVYNMSLQPAYIGRMIAFRESKGIYNSVSGKEGPLQKSRVDQGELERKKLWSVSAVRLDESHWYEWFEPEAAKMIVDPSVLPLAQAAIQTYLDAWTAPPKPKCKTKVKNKKHPRSSYFLSDKLTYKGHPDARVTGTTSGTRKGDTYHWLRRYYITRALFEINWRKSVKAVRRMIRADDLELMVWSAITQTFGDAKFIEESIKGHVARQLAARKKVQSLDHLDAEEKRLAKRLRFISVNIDDDNEAMFTGESAKIQKRLKEVRQAKAVADDSRQPELDPKALAKRVQAEMKSLGTQTGPRSKDLNQRLRAFCNTVVAKLEVDGDTLEVSIEIIVPVWALRKDGELGRTPDFKEGLMCGPKTTFQSKPAPTHYEKACFWGKIPYRRLDHNATFELKRIKTP